jgi:hypothetical protein
MAGGNLIQEGNFFGWGGGFVGRGWGSLEDGRGVGKGMGGWSASFGRGGWLCARRKVGWLEAMDGNGVCFWANLEKERPWGTAEDEERA